MLVNSFARSLVAPALGVPLKKHPRTDWNVLGNLIPPPLFVPKKNQTASELSRLQNCLETLVLVPPRQKKITGHLKNNQNVLANKIHQIPAFKIGFKFPPRNRLDISMVSRGIC